MDGAGIYIVLEALKRIDVMKAAFFVEEEVGCIGSGAVDLTFFSDCGYIIQGDRKGSGDLILDYLNSEICSKEFLTKCEPLFKHYGFKKTWGSFTDALELSSRGVGVCTFNFSVGYYNPHTDIEYTVIKELINSTEFAINLVNYLGKVKYPHVFEKKTYSSYTPGKYKGRGSYNDWDDDYSAYFGYGYEDYDYRKSKKLKCSCSDTHLLTDTFDLDCLVCNPEIKTNSVIFCECGGRLQDRKFNYKCPVCLEVYMKQK